MPKHTLFVCKSCHRTEEELAENQLSDGTILLDQLNSLCIGQFPPDEFEIQAVDCLWACSHGCVVSVSSHDKSTYLFVNLPPSESPTPLLEFMKLYIIHLGINLLQSFVTVLENLPKQLQILIESESPQLLHRPIFIHSICRNHRYLFPRSCFR